MTSYFAGIRHQAALFDLNDAMIELRNQFMFMGDHHNGGTHFVDLGEQLHDLIGEFRVDIAGGLVRQDEIPDC